MSYTNFVIIGVVCGSDLNGTGSELHINDDRVSDNGKSAIEERMDGELSVQVLIVTVG